MNSAQFTKLILKLCDEAKHHSERAAELPHVADARMAASYVLGSLAIALNEALKGSPDAPPPAA